MKKVLILAIMLSGCSSFTKKEIQTVIQPEPYAVKFPIPYCPAPPSFRRTKLEIEKIDLPNSDDGDIAKAYVASVLQLKGDISRLETELRKYKKIHDAYEEAKKQFDADTLKVLESVIANRNGQ